MNNIQWFPGHMKKASIQIEEKLKLVDCVIELLDARIPFSSRNNDLYNLTKNKKRLVLLTKADLADPNITAKWISYFKSLGFAAFFVDLNNNNDVKKIISEVEKLGVDKQQKALNKGMKAQPIRAMIIGIPNVGKSTLINKIARSRVASTENKPGHTRGQQWIKVSQKFELLDTPGILQTSYKNKNKAVHLALTGSIKETILPEDELANYLLSFLKEKYSTFLKTRYKLDCVDLDNDKILTNIAKNRGLLIRGVEDITKAQIVLLNEFKSGKIGRISLEWETKNI